VTLTPWLRPWSLRTKSKTTEGVKAGDEKKGRERRKEKAAAHPQNRSFQKHRRSQDFVWGFTFLDQKS